MKPATKKLSCRKEMDFQGNEKTQTDRETDRETERETERETDRKGDIK
jgi:hypothetical protein